MFDAAITSLILALPGRQETEKLPRKVVLEAIKTGTIGPDHWVWSPSDNVWKQVAEFPELQAPPVVLPALGQKSVPMARAANQPRPVPQVRLKPKAGAVPQSIYVCRDGRVCGPYSVETARTYMRTTYIKRDSLVCNEGEEEWIPAQDHPQLRGVQPPALPLHSPSPKSRPKVNGSKWWR